jgi:hypothetical protein
MCARTPIRLKWETLHTLHLGRFDVLEGEAVSKERRPHDLQKRLASKSAGDAVWLQQQAETRRLVAQAVADAGAPDLARDLHQDANRLAADADEVLDVQNRLDLTVLAAHGEMVAVQPQEIAQRAPIIDTLQQAPDLVSMSASRDRLDLLDAARATNTGLDAAVSIGAQNSLEKMLAHQAAAAHALAMQFMAASQRMLEAYQHAGGRNHAWNVEASRQANAAARMMGSFQSAMLTLQRLRTGGRQEVLVQHVHVAGGGQAVVAGRVNGGGSTGEDGAK